LIRSQSQALKHTWDTLGSGSRIWQLIACHVSIAALIAGKAFDTPITLYSEAPEVDCAGSITFTAGKCCGNHSNNALCRHMCVW
jgi:hypothetical protein